MRFDTAKLAETVDLLLTFTQAEILPKLSSPADVVGP